MHQRPRPVEITKNQHPAGGRPLERAWLPSLLTAAMLLVTSPGFTAAPPEAAALDQAEALVDAYYGDENQLSAAANLVQKSLTRAPSARAYTLAARIVKDRGHIVYADYQPGTKSLSRQLLERALALDPRYVPALSTLSELQRLDGDPNGACETALKGLQIDPNDSWINLDLAKCYGRLGKIEERTDYLNTAFVAGVGTTNRQRRAYAATMEMEVSVLALPQNVDVMREIAMKTEKVLDPKDAWTLGSLAEDFEEIADYDDAETYARKALRVMDYPAGHNILAAACYGKAAQRKLAHQDYRLMLKQARTAGGSTELVLRHFDRPDAEDAVAKLLPTVRELIGIGKRGGGSQP